MLFALQNIIVQGMLVTTMVVGGITGLVGGEEIEQLQAQYEQTVDQRESTIEKMRRLERRYEQLVERIDRLKSEGTEDIANRMSVEQLLSRSRELAEQLESLQKQVSRTDRTLERLRGQIVGRIDQAVATVEGRLREAPRDQRVTLVDQLNELRSIRHRYRAPLPKAPDLSEINETLRMIAEIESGRPDQMQAAADELEDTEDQLRTRLSAVQQKLDKLERSKTLARRARTFRAEESFFDEANRPRSVGHHRAGGSSSEESGGDQQNDGAAGSPTDGAGGQQDDVASRQPTAGAGGEVEEDQGAGYGGGSGEQPAPPGESRGGGAADPSAGFQRDGQKDRQPTDRPEPAQPAPGADDGAGGGDSAGGGGSDPFESPEFVMENEADPSTSVSTNFAGESELENRIQALKEEEERLRRQAERLDEKARELRDRAREMEDF